MRNCKFRPLRRSGGFSLVELMIGLLIGMLAIIVMMQVFSVSEGYKRTTTGGDDAQNDGAIALYGLQRDMQQSGLGIGGFQIIGCNVLLRPGVTLNAISPVTINHPSIPLTARDGGTDTVLIAYGNASGAAEGEKIEAHSALLPRVFTVAAAATSATASGAFARNDNIIVEPQSRPSPCGLTIDSVSDVTGANVTVAGAGVAGWSGSGIMYNLGQAPKVRVYAVHHGNLTVCDYITSDCGAAASADDAAVWVPIASNIVSLRAEYGRDTTAAPRMDGTVDTFDQTLNEATYGVACARVRVSAVRLVLVARSAQYDKNDKRLATASAPQWASSNAAIDLSGYADWQHYRYKLFQTVVPLRNMAWPSPDAMKSC